MPKRTARALTVVLLLGAGIGGGCSFGESGVEPPFDRIFLPGGLAVDPAGRWLYVVNSNSDLRYNAGTVVAVDATKAQLDREMGNWPTCPSPTYLPDENAVGGCCWDFFDSRVLNCDDRAYVDRKATVRLGSFGSGAVIEPRSDLREGVSGRLYISVRSEPSITFIDLAPGGTGPLFSCGGGPRENPLCDDAHKVRGEVDNPAPSALRLLEEPQSMTVDDKLGLLYVGHLIEGLSLISTCGATPTLQSVNRRIFSAGGLGVTSILLDDPGSSAGAVYVTSRNFSGRAAEVQRLQLRGVAANARDATREMNCAGPPRNRVDVVEAEGFFSSAFFSDGSDIRAMVQNDNRDRAYLLHRNSFGRQNPPAVVEIDRSRDELGHPRNRAVGLVEICAGATEMKWHDAGRGQRLYVTCFEAGQIYVLEPSPLAVAGIINVGRGPATLVFPSKTSTVGYVAGYSDNNVSVIDLAPGSPTENRMVQRIGFPQLRKR